MVWLLNKKIKMERMYDHGRRLVLYGMAGIDVVNYSTAEYKLLRLWDLPCDRCLDHLDLRADPPQHGLDRGNQRKPSEHRRYCLLHPHHHLVLWYCFLLYLQRTELNLFIHSHLILFHITIWFYFT